MPQKQKSLRQSSLPFIDELESQIEALLREQKSLNRRVTILQRRNLQLQEFNRMKDEFIAVASHQLRTPATGVKQYLSLLLEGYADPITESQKTFLEKAQESNDRQLTIIDDLLEVARVDSDSFTLHLKALEIRKIIREVVEELQSKLEHRHQRITYRLPKKTIPVLGDAEKLRMVFDNLIDNASNYSRKNSEICITLRSAKGFSYIDIRDQGVGISPKDMPRLFQKFSRIHNPLSIKVGGTGLGLYWAQRIVKFHGGEISVSSKPGEGSTFTVMLPIAKD